MSERPIFFATPIHRIRAERRKRQRELWMSVAVLFALVVLCGWMISLVKAGFFTGDNGGNGCLELLPNDSCLVPISGLAMAPVTAGSIMGLSVFAGLVVVLMLTRSWLETTHFCEQLRRQKAEVRRQELELHDPFAGITDGLDGDEMHRILTSVAAEGREVRRAISMAINDADLTEQIETLQRATERVTVLIRCVESLCERLQPCIDEKEVAV